MKQVSVQQNLVLPRTKNKLNRLALDKCHSLNAPATLCEERNANRLLRNYVASGASCRGLKLNSHHRRRRGEAFELLRIGVASSVTIDSTTICGSIGQSGSFYRRIRRVASRLQCERTWWQWSPSSQHWQACDNSENAVIIQLQENDSSYTPNNHRSTYAI